MQFALLVPSAKQGLAQRRLLLLQLKCCSLTVVGSIPDYDFFLNLLNPSGSTKLWGLLSL
jgi:hypothetical protein